MTVSVSVMHSAAGLLSFSEGRIDPRKTRRKKEISLRDNPLTPFIYNLIAAESHRWTDWNNAV